MYSAPRTLLMQPIRKIQRCAPLGSVIQPRAEAAWYVHHSRITARMLDHNLGLIHRQINHQFVSRIKKLQIELLSTASRSESNINIIGRAPLINK